MAYSKAMRFTCKTCNRCFDRDLSQFSELDKLCGNCGTFWCIPGVTPESKLFEEGLAILDNCLESLLDPSNDNFKLTSSTK